MAYCLISGSLLVLYIQVEQESRIAEGGWRCMMGMMTTTTTTTTTTTNSNFCDYADLMLVGETGVYV